MKIKPDLFDYSEMQLSERMKLASLLGRKKAHAEKMLKTVKKSGWNKIDNYRFASKGDILREIRPILVKAGLNVSATQIDLKEEWVEKRLHLTVTLLFTTTDLQTGYREYSTFDGKAKDSAFDSQHTAIYAAYTGAHKYFLSTNFNIDAGDDPEGYEEDNLDHGNIQPVEEESSTVRLRESRISEDKQGMSEDKQEELKKLAEELVSITGEGNVLGVTKMVAMKLKIKSVNFASFPAELADDAEDVLRELIAEAKLKVVAEEEEKNKKADPFARKKGESE